MLLFSSKPEAPANCYLKFSAPSADDQEQQPAGQKLLPQSGQELPQLPPPPGKHRQQGPAQERAIHLPQFLATDLWEAREEAAWLFGKDLRASPCTCGRS